MDFTKKVIPLTQLLGEQPFYLGGGGPPVSSEIEGIIPTLIRHAGGLDGIVGWAKDTFGPSLVNFFTGKGSAKSVPKKAIEVVVPRKPVSRRLSMSLTPTAGFETKADSVVAHNLLSVSPSYFAMEAAPNDPDLGPGTRIVFRQPLCWIGQGVDGVVGAFHAIPLSDVTISQNLFQVHPKYFGGRLSAFGTLFDRYHFKMLRLVMIPSAPTSVEGQVALAFAPDVFTPDVQGIPYNFYEIMTTMPSIAAPFREAFDFSVVHFGRDIKYCDKSTTSHADGRLDYAGVIMSDFVGPSSQEGKTGMQICFAEGVVDFYSPVAIHDYTIEKVPRSVHATFLELVRADAERKADEARRKEISSSEESKLSGIQQQALTRKSK